MLEFRVFVPRGAEEGFLKARILETRNWNHDCLYGLETLIRLTKNYVDGFTATFIISITDRRSMVSTVPLFLFGMENVPAETRSSA